MPMRPISSKTQRSERKESEWEQNETLGWRVLVPERVPPVGFNGFRFYGNHTIYVFAFLQFFQFPFAFLRFLVRRHGWEENSPRFGWWENFIPVVCVKAYYRKGKCDRVGKCLGCEKMSESVALCFDRCLWWVFFPITKSTDSAYLFERIEFILIYLFIYTQI